MACNILALPNGYNGDVVVLDPSPIDTDGELVLLKVADRKHLHRWARLTDLCACGAPVGEHLECPECAGAGWIPVCYGNDPGREGKELCPCPAGEALAESLRMGEEP